MKAKKKSVSDLKALLASERSDALAAMQSSKLSGERSDAMMYYLGDMSKDMPAPEGRSQAVSTDVADTVEGLMPSLMDIFCGSDEVVKFEPVGPEDEEASNQETDYVNHVFMQKNDGFLILYSFIKDCLLQKVGIIKVIPEEREKEERETYFGQSEDQFAIIAQQVMESNGSLTIEEHTPNEDGTHDVTVIGVNKSRDIKIYGVPPEEFGIERGARDIKTCNYCFHEPPQTVGGLIEQGYDAEQVKRLATTSVSDSETRARDTVDEQSPKADSLNEMARTVKVTEHYIRMDYEGKGRTCIYRVMTGGEGGDILNRDGEPDIERVDVYPFAAMTPVPIPHRFFGRSIADLVMDIQRIKTALIRGALDSTYLHLNPRVEVAEVFAGPNTLDDLLVSRPGGIVRTKQPGGLNWQVVPEITGSVYPMLEYMDATREWRTGVTKQGQGIDANALQNQSATAVNQAFTATQARMKLIARIIAETGVRDMFALLHATIRKHGGQAQTVRLRNTWVQVDPRQWKTRSDMTINVGLGDGGKAQQMAMATVIANFQKELVLGGKTNLVDDAKLYNSAAHIAKLAGHKSPDMFFNNPTEKGPDGQLKYPPPPPQPDPKLVELQAKNEIEKTQAQADIATNNAKLQNEAAMQERKFQFESALEEKRFELEKELKLLDAQIKIQTSTQDAEIKRETAQTDLQFKAADHQMRSQERAEKAEEAKKPKASIEVKHGAEELTGPLGEVVKQLGETVVNSQAQQSEMLLAALKEMSRPKKARKGKDGSWQMEPA